MKKLITGFLLGGIVFGSIVHGINTYESKSISYTPTDSSWSINNVGEALNDLYRIATLGDAKETQILSGKTAVVQGKTLTGAMVNKSAASQVGNSFSVNESGTIGEDSYTATGSIKIPVAGYYDTSSILTFDLTENNKSYYDLKLNDSVGYNILEKNITGTIYANTPLIKQIDIKEYENYKSISLSQINAYISSIMWRYDCSDNSWGDLSISVTSYDSEQGLLTVKISTSHPSLRTIESSKIIIVLP